MPCLHILGFMAFLPWLVGFGLLTIATSAITRELVDRDDMTIRIEMSWTWKEQDASSCAGSCIIKRSRGFVLGALSIS